MAATVAQRPALHKPEPEQQSEQTQAPEPIIPQRGVVTLYGYGINVRVDRGRLILQDGIGPARRGARFSRVGHGLERLIVIGSDGMVSLAALRWLADQNAAFVMLERDGSVLATTGPVRPSDAKLRRAQARADESGAALQIARGLIHHKLLGQEQVARGKLKDSAAADSIARYRAALANADSIYAVRLLESQGASVYWCAWQNVPVTFPRKDLPRVPEHWRTFGTRKSVLSGSPRLAVNPAQATLNYLYTVLLTESSLAISAMGLDPGLGYVHVDNSYRDSLSCDLMEPVRPQVDAFLFDWISGKAVKREWFFELGNLGASARVTHFCSVRVTHTENTIWNRILPTGKNGRHYHPLRRRAGCSSIIPTQPVTCSVCSVTPDSQALAPSGPRVSQKAGTILPTGKKGSCPPASCTCLQVVLGHFWRAK